MTLVSRTNSYYAGDAGYPAWTDAFRWDQVIDMRAYANGATEFEKFERARDELAARGGGVLYYPAGTYDFSAGPFDGPAGRGLMLRGGVVIRGEAPAGRPHAARDGTLALPTRFVFGFQRKAGGEVPRDWNLIGLQPEPGRGVQSVDRVGVCWVHLVGAVVFFGPELAWAGPTWKEGRSNRSVCVKPAWAGRKPDGTHPYDAKMAGPMAPGSNGGRYPDGSPFNDFLGQPAPLPAPGYVGAGRGRLVFGCVLEDACLLNDFDTRGRLEAQAGFGLEGFHMARYAARIQTYGSRVFVANNCLPMSATRNFKFPQITVETQPGRGNDFRILGTRESEVLFDYNRVIGIDVNKDLLSLLQAELLQRDDGGYCEEGVAVIDNFVFNHGHKGFSVAGGWCVIRSNRNERVLLRSVADPYGIGGWRLTLDGFTESAAGGGGMISDNYSRAFDISGRNLWVDGNAYNNLGSNPGGDGEGILCQLHGGSHWHSWAITRNRHDKGKGKSSFIGAWNADMLGALIAWNETPGWVGIAMPYRKADLMFVANGASPVNCGRDCVFTPPMGDPSGPADVRAEPAGTDAVRVTWTDTADNEVGFRVDRSLDGGPWVAIAYRPPRVEGAPENPQAWLDALVPPGRAARYRVAAIDDRDEGPATEAPTPVTLPR
jgi:hypothetical protein